MAYPTNHVYIFASPGCMCILHDHIYNQPKEHTLFTQSIHNLKRKLNGPFCDGAGKMPRAERLFD